MSFRVRVTITVSWGGGQEVNVIRGALDLTSKQALHGMTPMDKVREVRLHSKAGRRPLL